MITDIRFRIANMSALSWLLIISVVAFIASSFLWWQVVYKSPKRVWADMLKNNFATSGFTRHIESSQNGLEADEVAQLQTGGTNLVRTKTTLVQGSDRVSTEAITTDNAEYVRYLSIDTNRKTREGKPLNFSKAVGVWGKNEAGGSRQAFSQLLLGVIPTGNASPETRKQLEDFMNKHTVFVVNYETVKREKINGREAYVYEVQLLPQTYVEMLKIYGKGVGFGDQVQQLDPAAYKNAQPTSLVVSVDILSRNVVAVSYPGNDSRKETYGSYGVIKDYKLPRKTIPMTDLQELLSTQ